MLGAEAQAVLLLGERLAEDRDLGSHRGRDLHGDVSEPAHADDRDLLPAPIRQCCNGEYVVIPAHSNGAASSQLEAVGNLHDEASLTTICWL